jgi:hypothetical protein
MGWMKGERKRVEEDNLVRNLLYVSGGRIMGRVGQRESKFRRDGFGAS